MMTVVTLNLCLIFIPKKSTSRMRNNFISHSTGALLGNDNKSELSLDNPMSNVKLNRPSTILFMPCILSRQN